MLSSKVRNAPGMEDPPQPVLRRARTRRVMNAVGAAMAVVLIVGGSVIGARSLGKTGTIDPALPGTGQVVPWKDVPAGAITFPPACAASDVTLTADGSGAPALLVTAKDESVNCVIGRVTVRLFDAQGNELGVRVSNTGVFDIAVVNDPRIRQMMAFAWGNGCAPIAGPIRYEVEFLGDGNKLSTTSTRLGEGTLASEPGLPACPSRDPKTSMTFTGVNAEESGPPYKNPIDNLVMQLALPESVPAGGILEYQVTLRNPTRTSISLIDCPVFEQTLGVGERVETDQTKLNCDAAPAVILPGSSVTFAMQFPIPTNAWQPPADPLQSPAPTQGFIHWRFLKSGRFGDGGSVLITQPA